jgi:2'-5' RNA ligase
VALVDTTSWQPWQLSYEHGMLVIWPPDSERHYVNAFRAKHDPVSHAICEAHITVTQPFSSIPSGDTWVAISDVLAGCSAFEVHYGPVRSFLPAPVICLEIQPSSTVVALRNALHDTSAFDLTLPHTDDFMVHMTLTEGLSGNDVDEALLNRLKSEVNSGFFTCSEVAYLQPNSAFQFSLQRVLPLGIT